jgi:hypothetical protein
MRQSEARTASFHSAKYLTVVRILMYFRAQYLSRAHPFPERAPGNGGRLGFRIDRTKLQDFAADSLFLKPALQILGRIRRLPHQIGKIQSFSVLILNFDGTLRIHELLGTFRRSNRECYLDSTGLALCQNRR